MTYFYDPCNPCCDIAEGQLFAAGPPRLAAASGPNKGLWAYEKVPTLSFAPQWGRDGSSPNFDNVECDSNGFVYYPGSNNTVYKYNDTGKEKLTITQDSPTDVALHSDGSIYVAGGGTNFQLAKYDSRGVLVWSYSHPSDNKIDRIAFDASGNVYGVMDGANDIQKWTSTGGLVGGLWPLTKYNLIYDIQADTNDNIYVVALGPTETWLDKWDTNAGAVWDIDSTGDDWRRLAVDASLNVYVNTPRISGSSFGRTAKFQDGNPPTELWSFTHTNAGAATWGVAIDGDDGNIYAVQGLNGKLFKLDKDGNQLVAPSGGSPNVVRDIAVTPGRYPHFQ